MLRPARHRLPPLNTLRFFEADGPRRRARGTERRPRPAHGLLEQGLGLEHLSGGDRVALAEEVSRAQLQNSA